MHLQLVVHVIIPRWGYLADQSKNVRVIHTEGGCSRVLESKSRWLFILSPMLPIQLFQLLENTLLGSSEWDRGP